MTERERVLDELLTRWGSYANAAKVIRDMRNAFPAGSVALRELETFCRIWTSIGFDPSGQIIQRGEGRREVFFHIRLILSLDPQEVEALDQANPGANP